MSDMDDAINGHENRIVTESRDRAIVRVIVATKNTARMYGFRIERDGLYRIRFRTRETTCNVGLFSAPYASATTRLGGDVMDDDDDGEVKVSRQQQQQREVTLTLLKGTCVFLLRLMDRDDGVPISSADMRIYAVSTTPKSTSQRAKKTSSSS